MSDRHGRDIIIYQGDDGVPDIDVRLDSDTVWLSQQQLAELFQTSRTNVVEHIKHVYAEGELVESTTCRNFRQVRLEGNRQVQRDLPFYNLDLIISVGYRVRSAVATRFRIWATARLREYLVDGAAINERRLEQIGKLARILERANDVVVAGTAEVLQQYLPGLRLLERYDDKALDVAPGDAPSWQLTYREARDIVDALAVEFPENTLFGRERGEALRGIVAGIYQSFGGQDLYPSVQDKAANLLYLTVKDHPLTDGNKRTAATLFVHFLAQNDALRGIDGELLVSNNALAAITLMVALSDPREKDLMCALITTMLTRSAA